MRMIKVVSWAIKGGRNLSLLGACPRVVCNAGVIATMRDEKPISPYGWAQLGINVEFAEISKWTSYRISSMGACVFLSQIYGSL